MKTKEIRKALDAGHAVVLRDDPSNTICRDMFDGLVVVSLNTDQPARLATLSDKRKATIVY